MLAATHQPSAADDADDDDDDTDDAADDDDSADDDHTCAACCLVAHVSAVVTAIANLTKYLRNLLMTIFKICQILRKI